VSQGGILRRKERGGADRGERKEGRGVPRGDAGDPTARIISPLIEELDVLNCQEMSDCSANRCRVREKSDPG
jgi:hypothetical protein